MQYAALSRAGTLSRFSRLLTPCGPWGQLLPPGRLQSDYTAPMPARSPGNVGTVGNTARYINLIGRLVVWVRF